MDIQEDPSINHQEYKLYPHRHYCVNHPHKKPSWRCIECGKEFCEDCVMYKGIDHLNTARWAVCPECKGQCFDFKYKEEKEQQLKTLGRKTKRRTILLYTAFFVLLSLLIFFPNDFIFFFFAIFSIWLGPLRNIDLIYKLGATLILSLVNNPVLTLIDKNFWIMIRKDMPTVFTYYKKYLIESIIMFIIFLIVEKTSEGLSSVYYSRRQINQDKFGVHGWILCILSILMIIFSIVWIATNFITD